MTISPTATPAEQPRATMSDRGREEFAEEVSRLKVAKTPGPRDRLLTTLGLVLAAVGIVVTVLCYTQATGFDDMRDQLQTLILALTGVGLTVLGAALYVAAAITRFLRLWMLRLVYEQRDRAS